MRRTLKAGRFCLVLAGTLLRASSFSATAGAGPTGVACSNGVSDGGSGFVSASTGTVSCSMFSPFGNILTSSGSASGSWVTGDFSTSASATASSDLGNHDYSIQAYGTDTFVDIGNISLPSGISSASVTFGLTGLSGTATGLAGMNNPDASFNIITLTMIAGGTGGTSATSVACLNFVAVNSACPGGGLGLGFGPGAVAPITLTVSNGEDLELDVSLQSGAYSSALSLSGGTTGPNFASAGMTVDPVYLTLPAGAAFDSGITDFLSAASSTATPEPACAGLLAAGLACIVVFARKRSACTGLVAGSR